MKFFSKLNFFLFPFLWVIAFVFNLLESFTYSGFLPGTRVFLVWTIFSGVLVRIISLRKGILKKWLGWYKILFVFNKFAFLFFLITTAIFFLLEETHYPNYIFSTIHIQPSLFSWLCFLSGFFVFLDLGHVDKKSSLKKFLQEGEFTDGQSRLLHYKIPYLLLAIFILFFTIFNSLTVIAQFYQDARKPEGELAIQYALRKINIYQWIEKQFPRMRDVVFWCDEQQEKKELHTFDPSVIWGSYEGLIRVFMTNCEYKMMDIVDLPANEVVTYLKKKGDSFLLISINECQKKLETTGIIRREDEIQYLGQVNNDIICNSEQILPGLYRFSVARR